MVSILSWSPASGHPARFMAGRSAQARLRVEVVQKLAVEVVLLALKHQRQLIYSAE